MEVPAEPELTSEQRLALSEGVAEFNRGVVASPDGRTLYHGAPQTEANIRMAQQRRAEKMQAMISTIVQTFP